ncbi:MAG: hypothetical protein FJ090_10950 [Deltaproteobacteria bacterium]|nr:hypothetical protein [Deltaproteobacteria bacterium]
MLLLAALAAAAPDRAWIFVMDGHRASEGVDAGTENLEWLMGTMAPQGAIVYNLLNRDSTQTDGAHRGALSGRREPQPGLPWYDGRRLQRALRPTVFEAIGMARGLDLDGGYVDGNTVFMDSQGRSVYPGLGTVGAREYPSESESTVDDEALVDRSLARVAAQGAQVILLNLHEADKNGHNERWDGYVGSIALEDQLVRYVAGAAMGANDAVFIFADHGRHLDDRWRGHTDSCAGCRESFLLAWGPGIAQGVVVDGGWELQDIAATIAYVMGAELPLARGRPIVPVLAEPPPTPASSVVDPDLAVDANGRVHLFASRLKDAAEGEGIVHRYSDDQGKTWTDADDVPLGEGVTPEEVRALATPTGLRVSWRAYDEALGTWTVVASEGDGESWSVPAVIDSDVFSSTLPEVVDGPDGRAHFWSWDEFVGIADAPADWIHVASGVQTPVTGPGSFHLPAEVELLSTPDDVVGAFAAIPAEDYFEANDNRDIWVMLGGQSDAPHFARVSADADYSYWPSLVRTGDGLLHLAWASRQGANLEEGGWRLAYAQSGDSGNTWTTPAYLDRDTEAWRPTLLASGDALSLAWLEVSGEAHRLLVAPFNGGVLGEAKTVAFDNAAIDRVAAVPIDGGFLLAWGEARGTLDHTLATARVKADGSLLDAEPPVTEEPPCGCDGSGAAWLVGAGALARALTLRPSRGSRRGRPGA